MSISPIYCDAWIYRDISDSLGTLLWIKNELWSILQHITLCSILQCSSVVCDCYITFTACSYIIHNFFQHHLATFAFIQLWNWLVPSSWHCVLTKTFHFYFLRLKPTQYLAFNMEWPTLSTPGPLRKNTAFWNISAIYRRWLHSLGTRSAAIIWKGSQL